jgi:hypothetical protein
MSQKPNQLNRQFERTAFQTPHYHPTIDLRTDVVFVYGWDETLPERIRTWHRQGYRVHFMTGAAWGHYDDYLEGRFDGQTHFHEAQVARNGERLDHGNAIFYIVPTPPYVTYLKHIAEKVIDAGADALHLEEPEFWSRAGYSRSFQELWQAHYGSPWQAPHTSPNAWFQAARLKYQLYTDALEAVFAHAKAYAAQQGRSLQCYVDSHSLINYAQWGIVSPESNLAHLQTCDGYVCQVWTGTARTPNHADGIRAERTFQTAYLEYSQMAAMVLATGRKIWFLADPIEDDPRHDWDDYRRNYHLTLAASLMIPEINSYEVMPWPDRVFNHPYPHSLPPEQRSTIAPGYATELLNIVNALANMPGVEKSQRSGTHSIGVAISDTMLFERGFDEPEQPVLRRAGDIAPPDQIYRLRPGANPEFDFFFGQTLPLLKRGLPLRLVHLEHVGLDGYLAGVDVLILSYDAMKPPAPETHSAIAGWVRNGGVLVCLDDETPRPFDDIAAWWRAGERAYAKPVYHLLELLGITPAEDLVRVGNGAVLTLPIGAGELAHSHELAEQYVQNIRQAYLASRKQAGAWEEAGILKIQRGKYLIAASLSQDGESTHPHRFEGDFINLFDGNLPVCSGFDLKAGEAAFLLDLAADAENGEILAATGRVETVEMSAQTCRVVVSCPLNVPGQFVARFASRPASVLCDGQAAAWAWDEKHRLLRVRYDGSPAGLAFVVNIIQ